MKRKFYAAARVIQRAIKIRKARRGLKKALIPSLEMMGLSAFQNFKMYIKAYMLGWKTRKIMNCDSIQNYKRQVIELSEYYRGQNNKYVLKSKEDYITAINRALANRNWWTDLINSKSIQERKERLQKMREKKKDNKVTNNYRSNEEFSYSRPAQDSKNTSKGNCNFAFDFSRTTSTMPRSYEEEQEIKRQKRVEENKQKKKTNFLKRRANLKYDPMKAAEDDKTKLECLSKQDKNSYMIDEDSMMTDNQPMTSAASIKLGALIEQEKRRKEFKKKMTVKEIMLSPTPQVQKNNVNVRDSFQKLDYLKKIPKRID